MIIDGKSHTWKSILQPEIEKEYFLQIKQFLAVERLAGKIIYPPENLVNNAFALTPFHKIKVVILGQDPYHNDGQAHGLSFSVPDGVKPPPSLKNIFKELTTDCNIPLPTHGNLTQWALQGVFLLNSILTVRAHEPASHHHIGWQQFTDFAIQQISAQSSNVVFMLWGSYAQQKELLIDAKKHLILKAAHPSPFSAYKGFLGCKHFSAANEYLNANNLDEIDWNIL